MGSADHVAQKAGLLALCAVFLSYRGAETRLFLSQPHLAGETLLPCSCRGTRAWQAVQSGRWFPSTTFARCFFLFKPNPICMPARRGFPRPTAAAGDAEQQEPLLSAEGSCRAGLLVGRVSAGLLLNSPKCHFQKRGINAHFELQKLGCVRP